MSEAFIALGGAVCTAAGVVGKAVVDRIRNRDRLSADQASSMIEKLWQQNQQLNTKVDDCERKHRECEARAARLEANVEGLREDVDELRRRIDQGELPK